METKTAHVAYPLLRTERMPHIWCPGCGVGVTVNCFAGAIARSGIDKKKLVIVSGIGCTGRVAGYVKLDTFHTTHAGRYLCHGPEARQSRAQGRGLQRRWRPVRHRPATISSTPPAATST